MWKCAVITSAALLPSSVAMAGAVIEVAPVVPGPYAPGQRVEVGVRLSQQQGGEDIYLRMLQFDFADTDPALTLDEVFRFDYSAQAVCRQDPELCGTNYAEFPVLTPIRDGVCVATVYLGWEPDVQRQIQLPGAGTIDAGSIGVTLPTIPGDYVLDVMNADRLDRFNAGARIDFGFPCSAWFAHDEDQIAGGRFTADTTAGAGFMFGFTPAAGTIVPEPTALALLALGAVVLGVRRP